MIGVVIFARLLLAVIFIAAPAAKLRSRSAFALFVDATGQMTGIPVRLTAPLAGAVAAAEVGTVVALLLAPPIGFVAAIVLLALFSIAVVRSIRSGAETTCACFGAEGSKLSWSHVVRNVLLGLVATIGLGSALLAGREPGLIPAGSFITPAVAAFVLGVVVTRWDDLAYTVAGAGFDLDPLTRHQ